jgi:hypothetical protein
MSDIEQYIHPRGPISWSQLRLYLLQSGYGKLGKGMKNLQETIQNSGNHIKIGRDLKQIVSIMHKNESTGKGKKPSIKKQVKKKQQCSSTNGAVQLLKHLEKQIKKLETDVQDDLLPELQSALSYISKSVSDTTMDTEKVEADVMRHLILREKPLKGSFKQKIEHLVEALDEELEDEPAITFDEQ